MLVELASFGLVFHPSRADYSPGAPIALRYIFYDGEKLLADASKKIETQADRILCKCGY